MQHDERGQMGVTLLLSVSIAVTFFTLAFDVGLWAYDHRRAQAQAEAAAHAAVVFLPSTDRSVAENARDQWLVLNGSSPTENTCPQEVRDDVADALGAYDTVRVCIRRQAPGIFSPLARIAGVYVSASAAARVADVPSGYALMALNSAACRAFYVHGNVEVVVTGGGGSFTGSSCSTGEQALNLQGNASFVTSVNDVVGGWTKDPAATLLVVPNDGASPLNDPYEPLTQPCSTSCSGLPCKPLGDYSAANLTPGRFCANYDKTSNSTVTLAPGLYIFEGSLQVSAGTFTSNGAGVLIYLTCPSSPCAGADPGHLRFTGSAVVDLRGLASASDMVIWADRTAGLNADGTPRHVIQITGNNATAIDGRIYGVHSHITLDGNTNVNVVLNASLVASTIEFLGNNRFSYSYNAAQAPPSHQIAIIE